jgi:hypothetical protein
MSQFGNECLIIIYQIQLLHFTGHCGLLYLVDRYIVMSKWFNMQLSRVYKYILIVIGDFPLCYLFVEAVNISNLYFYPKGGPVSDDVN